MMNQIEKKFITQASEDVKTELLQGMGEGMALLIS